MPQSRLDHANVRIVCMFSGLAFSLACCIRLLVVVVRHVCFQLLGCWKADPASHVWWQCNGRKCNVQRSHLLPSRTIHTVDGSACCLQAITYPCGPTGTSSDVHAPHLVWSAASLTVLATPAAAAPPPRPADATLRAGDVTGTTALSRSRSTIIASGSVLDAHWLFRSITLRYIASIVGAATY